MSAKANYCCVFFLSILVVGTARSEAPYAPSGTANPAQPGMASPAPSLQTTTSAADVLPNDTAGMSALSTWITYPRANCCGPMGGNGPIKSELYLRSGISFPVGGGGFFNKLLQPGWEIQGGGRSMFFNPSCDAAWVVDLSLANVNNVGKNLDEFFEIDDAAGPTQENVRALNRTYVGFGGGKEWWLMGTGAGCNGDGCGSGLEWRAGVDGGGLFGTVRMDANDAAQISGFRRRNDVMSGLYIAAHTDMEIPCGCFTYILGLRLVYDYTWMDIAHGQKSNLADINLLVTAGLRF